MYLTKIKILEIFKNSNNAYLIPRPNENQFG